jgi:hypothetical protein
MMGRESYGSVPVSRQEPIRNLQEQVGTLRECAGISAGTCKERYTNSTYTLYPMFLSGTWPYYSILFDFCQAKMKSWYDLCLPAPSSDHSHLHC